MRKSLAQRPRTHASVQTGIGESDLCWQRRMAGPGCIQYQAPSGSNMSTMVGRPGWLCSFWVPVCLEAACAAGFSLTNSGSKEAFAALRAPQRNPLYNNLCALGLFLGYSLVCYVRVVLPVLRML